MRGRDVRGRHLPQNEAWPLGRPDKPGRGFRPHRRSGGEQRELAGGGEATMQGEVGRGEVGVQDGSTEDPTGLEASQRQGGPGSADSWAENPGPG